MDRITDLTDDMIDIMINECIVEISKLNMLLSQWKRELEWLYLIRDENLSLNEVGDDEVDDDEII